MNTLRIRLHALIPIVAAFIDIVLRYNNLIPHKYSDYILAILLFISTAWPGLFTKKTPQEILDGYRRQ